jgi:hypothetical protein
MNILVFHNLILSKFRTKTQNYADISTPSPPHHLRKDKKKGVRNGKALGKS